MAGQRLEVRLDPERREKLIKIAAARGTTISYAVRELIDEAFEQTEKAKRRRLVEQIAQAHVEDMPEPDELSRQLDSTYDIPALSPDIP